MEQIDWKSSPKPPLVQHTWPQESDWDQPLMIGRVAKLYDITVQTLRHYDKIGLFRPEITNPETGYRYYSCEQLRQLEFILFFRRLQFSLAEIQEAMAFLSSGGDLYELLRKRDAILEQEIGKMQALRTTIDDLFRLKYEGGAPLRQVRIQEFPPRPVFLVETPGLSVQDGDFATRLMEYRKTLVGSLPAIQTEVTFGAVASSAEFSTKGVLAYEALYLEPPAAQKPEEVRRETIPGGSYLTLRFSRRDSQPESAYRTLIAFAEKHRFQTDDRIFEVGAEPMFSSISRQAELTELQLRVEFA